MGKVTKRKLQAIETKNRIYEAAAKLMEQKGFENITIENISKEAKVSVGAFYHHYMSKSDILNEIYRRGDDFFREKVVGHLSGNTACELIVSYFDHFAKFYILLGVDHIKALYKTQSKIFINENRFMITVLRDIIDGGISRNEFDSDLSAGEMTDFLFATARGLAYTWCLHDGQYPFEDTMHRYMNRLVRSLST